MAIELGPKRKIGFVCSGGATKAAAFHLGVALALKKHGFRFAGGFEEPTPGDISIYVGSSAGAIIGAYLAAGFPPEIVYDSFFGEKKPKGSNKLPRLSYQQMFKLRPSIAKEQVGGLLTLSPKIISELSRGNLSSLLQLKWLKTTGLFTTKGIEQYLRELLPSNEFKDYGADLFINTTPLNHPAKIVFGKYPRRPMKLGPVDPHCRYRNHATISEACAASMSVPILYAPYPIKSPDGQTMHYIDGEVRDTLSAHVAAEAGADLVIASYTHQPYALLKDVGSLTAHGLPSIVVQTIYLMIEQKIRTQIRTEQKHRSAINEVAKFCKANGLNRKTTTALCELLEHELGHKMSVDTIYIHPSPKDGEIFFNEHFSLSMQNLTKLVDCGFNATTETLRHYRFSGLNGEDNV